MFAFPPDLVRKRQKALFEKLPPNSIMILHSDGPKTKSNDVEYRFRPSSNVLYLTGITDPFITVLISRRKLKDGEEHKITVFRKRRRFEEIIWVGDLTSDEELKKVCDEVKDIETFESNIAKLIQNTECLFLPIGDDSLLQDAVLRACFELKRKARSGELPPKMIQDADLMLGELRAKKDEHEIGLMKKAASLTKRALRELEIKPGMMEYEIESQLIRAYRSYGGEEAFPTIVASGRNSTILHYSKNSSPVQIPCVVDTGIELNFYASDITRTFAPSELATDAKTKDRLGTVSQIISEVERIQKKIIERIRPGVSFEDLNEMAQREISNLLVELGILHHPITEIIDRKLFRPFFPHRVGHHIGLDVHDICPYYDAPGEPKKLEEGNVITVEPGVYIPESETLYIKDGSVTESKENGVIEVRIPSHLRGIGVRVEDVILVRREGAEVLE